MNRSEGIASVDALRRAAALARAMTAHGLAPGQRVAIYCNNDVRMLLAILAVERAGGVWIPLSLWRRRYPTSVCSPGSNPHG